MTDKELKRLSRAELLELLIAQINENRRLEDELAMANIRLKSRDICIANAGSIAEAALKLNNVFQAAQEAADQYLYSVMKMTESDADSPALDENDTDSIPTAASSTEV